MESLHQWSSVQRKSSVQHKSDCTSQFDSTCVFNLLLSRRASATSLPPALSKKLIYFLVFDRFSAGECALQVTTLSKMLFLPPAPNAVASCRTAVCLPRLRFWTPQVTLACYVQTFTSALCFQLLAVTHARSDRCSSDSSEMTWPSTTRTSTPTPKLTLRSKTKQEDSPTWCGCGQCRCKLRDFGCLPRISRRGHHRSLKTRPYRLFKGHLSVQPAFSHDGSSHPHRHSTTCSV